MPIAWLFSSGGSRACARQLAAVAGARPPCTSLALSRVCSAAHTVSAGVLRFRQVSRMQSEGSTRGIHGTAMSRAVRDAHLAAQLIPADA